MPSCGHKIYYNYKYTVTSSIETLYEYCGYCWCERRIAYSNRPWGRLCGRDGSVHSHGPGKVHQVTWRDKKVHSGIILKSTTPAFMLLRRVMHVSTQLVRFNYLLHKSEHQRFEEMGCWHLGKTHRHWSPEQMLAVVEWQGFAGCRDYLMGWIPGSRRQDFGYKIGAHILVP